MLRAIDIRNVVLIDRLTLTFPEQGALCALTGETGAGKSILLDSLGLALGRRAESGLVRRGADQAIVSATFEPDAGHPSFRLLDDQGIPGEDLLILRRTLGADGRSRAFINDQPVSIGFLGQVGQTLVEVHGQFDTHGLLDPKTHRGLLDRYACVSAQTPAAWEAWQSLERRYQDARRAAEQARTEEDFLRQSIEDLDALSPEPGEDATLSELRERLMHRENMLSALGDAHRMLCGDQGDGGAEPLVGGAARVLERMSAHGGSAFDEIIAALDRAAGELSDAMASIETVSADLTEGERSLEEIDDRLHAIRAQARKHGCAPDDLPARRDALAARLDLITHEDERLAALEHEISAARAAYIDAARAAHDRRCAAAAELDSLIAGELVPLKLGKAQFETQILDLPETGWGPYGYDQVRFLVATNPGSAPGPLHKIASGGELSRFMLAMKVVMSRTGDAGTLIFDEVDSGIGGSTADAVGERLARLGRDRQVLVVTHAPQVAARAAYHWIVSKTDERDEGGAIVRTGIHPLDDPAQRREEIARMLSGAEITPEARAAAEKLLEAQDEKDFVRA